jgi:hypothetical protein
MMSPKLKGTKVMAAKKSDAEIGATLVEIDANPGHKVTTIRLTNNEYDQVAIFAKAMGDISLTEFVGKAVREYLKACMKDSGIRKEVQRQIAKQQRMLDQFASSIFGNPDGEG